MITTALQAALGDGKSVNTRRKCEVTPMKIRLTLTLTSEMVSLKPSSLTNAYVISRMSQNYQKQSQTCNYFGTEGRVEKREENHYQVCNNELTTRAHHRSLMTSYYSCYHWFQPRLSCCLLGKTASYCSSNESQQKDQVNQSITLHFTFIDKWLSMI